MMIWLRIFIDLVAIRSDFCPCANWSRLVTKTGAIVPVFVTVAPVLVAIAPETTVAASETRAAAPKQLLSRLAVANRIPYGVNGV